MSDFLSLLRNQDRAVLPFSDKFKQLISAGWLIPEKMLSEPCTPLTLSVPGLLLQSRLCNDSAVFCNENRQAHSSPGREKWGGGVGWKGAHIAYRRVQALEVWRVIGNWLHPIIEFASFTTSINLLCVPAPVHRSLRATFIITGSLHSIQSP